MQKTYKAAEIETGYHPDGYRIDKTASPMNFYTQWKIADDGTWLSPKPVDFSVFPDIGWIQSDSFDWSREHTSDG